MMNPPRPRARCLVCALATIAPAAAGLGASDEFLLIGRDHRAQSVRLVGINGQSLVHGDQAGGWVNVPLDQCVALVAEHTAKAAPHVGLVRLADGQRFPGEALSGARAADDVLVWNHRGLGRMEIPLERIESVVFVQGAATPRIAPAGASDVLLLANGDRLEGFVLALGDPISMEVPGGDGPPGSVHTIGIPLDRAAAVSMVTPGQRSTGRRLWLTDGTVVDVMGLMLGDDGLVRLVGLPFGAEREPDALPLAAVAAVLFRPQGLTAFADLTPTQIKGPPMRYVVPSPSALDDFAPLGLLRVEFRGPLLVRYELPISPVYLSAEARLPIAAKMWGDCVPLIRDDDNEVFRARLNADQPSTSIGITLRGAALTIEITEAAHGPIQDHVVLHRAMLLPAQP